MHCIQSNIKGRAEHKLWQYINGFFSENIDSSIWFFIKIQVREPVRLRIWSKLINSIQDELVITDIYVELEEC